MVMKEEERKKKKKKGKKKAFFVCLERWRLQQTRWAQGEGYEVDPSVKVIRAHTESEARRNGHGHGLLPCVEQCYRPCLLH